jgi:hypothetical protein
VDTVRFVVAAQQHPAVIAPGGPVTRAVPR